MSSQGVRLERLGDLLIEIASLEDAFAMTINK